MAQQAQVVDPEHAWDGDTGGYYPGLPGRAAIPFETALVNYAEQTEYLCASISYGGVSDPDNLAALIRARRLSEFSEVNCGYIRTAPTSVLPR